MRKLILILTSALIWSIVAIDPRCAAYYFRSMACPFEETTRISSTVTNVFVTENQQSTSSTQSTASNHLFDVSSGSTEKTSTGKNDETISNDCSNGMKQDSENNCVSTTENVGESTTDDAILKTSPFKTTSTSSLSSPLSSSISETSSSSKLSTKGTTSTTVFHENEQSTKTLDNSKDYVANEVSPLETEVTLPYNSPTSTSDIQSTLGETTLGTEPTSESSGVSTTLLLPYTEVHDTSFVSTTSTTMSKSSSNTETTSTTSAASVQSILSSTDASLQNVQSSTKEDDYSSTSRNTETEATRTMTSVLTTSTDYPSSSSTLTIGSETSSSSEIHLTGSTPNNYDDHSIDITTSAPVSFQTTSQVWPAPLSSTSSSTSQSVRTSSVVITSTKTPEPFDSVPTSQTTDQSKKSSSTETSIPAVQLSTTTIFSDGTSLSAQTTKLRESDTTVFTDSPQSSVRKSSPNEDEYPTTSDTTRSGDTSTRTSLLTTSTDFSSSSSTLKVESETSSTSETRLTEPTTPVSFQSTSEVSSTSLSSSTSTSQSVESNSEPSKTTLSFETSISSIPIDTKANTMFSDSTGRPAQTTVVSEKDKSTKSNLNALLSSSPINDEKTTRYTTHYKSTKSPTSKLMEASTFMHITAEKSNLVSTLEMEPVPDVTDSSTASTVRSTTNTADRLTTQIIETEETHSTTSMGNKDELKKSTVGIETTTSTALLTTSATELENEIATVDTNSSPDITSSTASPSVTESLPTTPLKNTLTSKDNDDSSELLTDPNYIATLITTETPTHTVASLPDLTTEITQKVEKVTRRSSENPLKTTGNLELKVDTTETIQSQSPELSRLSSTNVPSTSPQKTVTEHNVFSSIPDSKKTTKPQAVFGTTSHASSMLPEEAIPTTEKSTSSTGSTLESASEQGRSSTIGTTLVKNHKPSSSELTSVSSEPSSSPSSSPQCPDGYIIGTIYCFLLVPASEKMSSYQSALSTCKSVRRQTLSSLDKIKNTSDINMLQENARLQGIDLIYDNGLGSRMERFQKRANVYNIHEQSLIDTKILKNVSISDTFLDIAALCILPQYDHVPDCDLVKFFFTYGYFESFVASPDFLKPQDRARVVCIYGNQKDVHVTCNSLGAIYPHPSLIDCEDQLPNRELPDTTGQLVSSCKSCFKRGTDFCSEFLSADRKVAGFVCHCKEHFYMSRCYKMRSMCTENFCGSHGTCHSQEGETWCDCQVGFTGKKCEISLREKYYKDFGYVQYAGGTITLGGILLKIAKVGVMSISLASEQGSDIQDTHQRFRTFLMIIAGILTCLFSNPTLFGLSQLSCRFTFILVHFCYISALLQWLLEGWNVNQVLRNVHPNQWDTNWDGNRPWGIRITLRLGVCVVGVASVLMVTCHEKWNQLAASWTCLGVVCESNFAVWIILFSIVGIMALFAGAFYESSLLIKCRRPLLAYKLDVRIERSLGFNLGQHVNKCRNNDLLALIGFLLLACQWISVIVSSDHLDKPVLGMISVLISSVYSAFTLYQGVMTAPEDLSLVIQLLQRWAPRRLAPTYNPISMWSINEIREYYSVPKEEREARYEGFLTFNQKLFLHHKFDTRLDEILGENEDISIEDGLLKVYLEEMHRLDVARGSSREKETIQEVFSEYIDTVPRKDPRSANQVRGKLELVVLSAEDSQWGIRLAKFFIVPPAVTFQPDLRDDSNVTSREAAEERRLFRELEEEIYSLARTEAHAQTRFINSAIVFSNYGNNIIR